MRYTIDEAVANKLGLPLPQVLLLIFIKTGHNLDNTIKDLLDKEALVQVNTSPSKYMITQRWNDVCDNILLTSDNSIPADDEITPIAEKLMAIFPKGKKPGTPYYWKCNKREVMLKLKSFFKLYGRTYTEEEILDAARRYVDSFNGDYRFMRLLKYFIWKRDNTEGEVSELATFIDNDGQEEDVGDDWVTELV